MKTNILGTSNLLENALYYWDKNNQISKIPSCTYQQMKFLEV